MCVTMAHILRGKKYPIIIPLSSVDYTASFKIKDIEAHLCSVPRRNILCTLGLKVCDPCFVHIRILKLACVGGICILECMRVTFCECSQRENPKRYTTTNSLFRYCGF